MEKVKVRETEIERERDKEILSHERPDLIFLCSVVFIYIETRVRYRT